MLLSEKYLRELVNPPVSAAELGHRLTMAGLEVDALKPFAPPFSGVVVGQVLACEPHPDADKLRVTQVDIGRGQPLQIVCGASNVRTGLKVPVATVGAVLPGDFRIKEAKLRGVASAGMLCAEQELGLAEQSDGLWALPAEAPVGACLREYLALDDHQIELGITPNRGDCLSLRGLARETAAIFAMDVALPAIAPVPATHAQTLAVHLDAPTACPRYAGRLLRGIRAHAASPAWLVDALQRFGLRSLHPVVDVTNWVMLSLGQPMHAFDCAAISGDLHVRGARAGESLTLLDGQTVTLQAGTLLIADDRQPLALAGIMGGQASAVQAETVDLFLEAAHFAPLALAGQARRYGLHTDASHRFERGVDPALPQLAIDMATALILDIAGGEPGPVVLAEAGEHLPAVAPITLRRERIARVLGFSLADETVVQYLSRLGLQVAALADGSGWQVVVPSHRFDLTLEVDLIEELARLYGYNRLPVTVPVAAIDLRARPERDVPLRRLKQVLVDLDYQEAITFSFVEPGLQRLFDPEHAPLALTNPISAELSVMRTSLWPGLVQAVAYNQARQQARVRLFESGLRFVPTAAGLSQTPVLAGVIAGKRQAAGWTNSKEPLDFYDLKGNIESLLAVAGVAGQVRFEAARHPALHPGQSAQLWLGEQSLGWLGALHPTLLRELDLTGPVYVFELALTPLQGQARLPAFRSLSRFPEMRRDLALVVPAPVTAAEVLAVAGTAAGTALQGVQVFDVYRGAGLPAGHYSLAISLSWQEADRTLLESEVQGWVDEVLTALQAQLQVSLR